MSHRSHLPAESVLQKERMNFDYVDAFEETLHNKNKVTSSQLAVSFFTSAPSWIDALFQLRNRIVALIGLKTSGNTIDKEKLLKEFQCLPGQRLGLFKVFSKNENEVVLGEDDVHLNFRISLFIAPGSNQHVTITTMVKLNNRFGKFYFALIKPFHRLIVPSMLNAIVQDLELVSSDQSLQL